MHTFLFVSMAQMIFGISRVTATRALFFPCLQAIPA